MHRKGDGERVASDNGRDGAAGSAVLGRTVIVPSEVAQNLRVAEDGDITRYDASARNLVAEKPVLAYILKSALDEYVGYMPQEIAERFIDGEPEVGRWRFTKTIQTDRETRSGKRKKWARRVKRSMDRHRRALHMMWHQAWKNRAALAAGMRHLA